MRACWCGPPNIYNSREEAEVATGHLRFYVAGSESKNLRVLQKKDDFGWHCACGNNEYHAAYEELNNFNGKRPAQGTEIDLIAQNQDSQSAKSRQSIDRVVPAPIEATQVEEEHSQAPKIHQAETPALAQSMWTQACGIFSRAVSTMGSPLVTLFGQLREQISGDAYDTVDTRRKDIGNDTVVVKRLKRQATVSPTGQQPPYEEDDGFDDLVWTSDITKHIGHKRLEHILNSLVTQRDSLDAGKVISGPSIADIEIEIEHGQDLAASIGIHKYREYLFGPTLADETEAQQAENLLTTLGKYRERLDTCINFIEKTYDGDRLEKLKTEYPEPTRRLTVGNVMFRQTSMMAGNFFAFLRSLSSVREMDAGSLKAMSQLIVDANAVHKQEMLPSYVEVKRDPMEEMPGFFPADEPAVMEEIPADDVEIQPLYDVRFPDMEPSNWDEQIKPGEYRLVPKPKGILKPSKEWLDPDSPRYAASRQKERKIAFISPISKFIQPAHIPSKIMTPQQAERIVKAQLRAEVLRDEHSVRVFEASRTVPRQEDMSIKFEDKWNLESLERDDHEMGLTYHARKYDGFLNDLHDDLEKRAEEQQENLKNPTRNLHLTPRRRMVRIPLPPLPSTPEIRRQRAHLFVDDTDSPAVSSPNPLMRRKAEEPPIKLARPTQKKPAPRTLEEFFAEDDEDTMAISIAKLDQLQIDRQLRNEFELGVQRELEEKRKREEEEARREKERRLEEERRRKEEERRRKDEERRREQEARRQKEAEEFAALTGLRQPTRPLITNLSSDWNTRVANAARANPAAELVKTLEGQPLTRRDFEEKLLPATAWLNDNVIIGSILHIADYINKTKGTTDQEPKCAAFTSYFWPRLLSHGPSGCGRLLRRAGVRKANILNIDTILIPICAQSHWTLAVIRPKKRTVAHIDSMRGGGGDEKVKEKLLELVRFILEDQFVEADWRAIDYEAPRQTNGWDCGVFTITNAMCMALGLNPKSAYTERELTLQRRRLAAMLLNEGFKGEFSLDGL